jgi:hypothetical protein
LTLVAARLKCLMQTMRSHSAVSLWTMVNEILLTVL